MRQSFLIIGTVFVCGFASYAAPTRLAAGGGVDETPTALAAGPSGSTYVAGTTRNRRRGGQIYLAKIDASGTRREFTAYLGGSGDDAVNAIATDRAGNIYLAGHTTSADFPSIGGKDNKPSGGMDVFLAKFDGKGNLLSSTLLGGAENESAQALAIDQNSDVYVTGWTTSTDFPASGEKTGPVSGFVVRLRAATLISGSLFTGSGHGIAVDLDGFLYIAGTTEDGVKTNAFLLKLNERYQPVYRTAVTGNGDQAASAIALSPYGDAWIAGWTTSADFAASRSGEFAGARDAFAARFNAEGRHVFSKLIGGKSDDEAQQLAVDAKGNVYISGTTRSEDFPVLASSANATGLRSFVVKLSAAADRVLIAEDVASALTVPAVRMAVDAMGNVVLSGSDGKGASVRSVATCRYGMSKALHSFDAAGGEAAALVDTASECVWAAESNSSWITVTRLGDRIEFLAAPNDTGAPRAGTIAAGGQRLVVLQSAKGDGARPALTGAIRTNAGFQTSRIPACDDCSAPAVAPLGFPINFFGTTYTQAYVNNNGNVTFDSSNSTFTPDPISAIRRVLIAAFWADVDTRGNGSGLTTYGTDLINGRKAFGVNWVDVGYYSSKTNKLNSMQLVLIDRGDLGTGFFDIELNYAGIQWETGDASGGANGLGGNSARAGFSNGTGTAGTYFELPGSGVRGALLDGGANSLVFNSTNSGGVAGRYVYNVRAGLVVCGLGLASTFASVTASGGSVPVSVTASNPTCTWGVSGLPSWITVSTAPPGYGTGTVSLIVAPNTGPFRSANRINIGGQLFTVSQAGTSGPIVCPPVTFARAADVSMMSGSAAQGTIAGVERTSDGSLTQHNFTGNSTTYTQTSTPQYQQSFSSCIGRTPGTLTPPINYRLLAEQRGTSAANPIFTDLTGTGRSTAVGVSPYSQDASKLQVWNANANRTPGTKFNYDVPANPQKLAAADFNNDGKQDVLLLSLGVTGGNQGILSIFLGNGDGTLGTRRDINVGSNPQSATVFDFNSDNKLDVAVSNAGSSTLMILNGNGDGTFQSPFTVPDAVRSPITVRAEAAGPRGVAAGDLNKDGRPDLVIGHNDGVDIRLGNGNGTFQAQSRVAQGFVSSFVAIGDLNKDGNPDIAVSSETSSIITILLGNGNGTFRPPSSYVTRDHAGPFFISDFDWDSNPDVVFSAGHPDAMVAAAGDTNITVLYGRGDGTLHGPPAIALPSLGDFTSGDFNGDGRPDVVSTAPLLGGLTNPSGLYLALNNGTGTLVPQTPISVGGLPLSRIASGDFNGDGRRDVAVTSGSTVQVLTGTGTGGFNTPSSFPGGAQMTSILTAELNGDNRLDLIVTDDGEDRVSVALGNGNGTFQARTLYTAGVDPKSVAVADVNADTRPDLIVVNFGQAGNDASPGGISVLLGNGNGTFQAATNFASSLHPTSVTIGDVNGDGRPDLMVSTGGSNFADYIAIHLGNGNGTFTTPTLLPVSFGPAQTALTDFNGDGKTDIVAGHCCGDVQMGVLLGNGNGTFAAETNIPNTGNGSSFVVATDLNADARPDIVFGANSTSGAGAFIGTLLNATGGAVINCTFTLSQASYAPGTAAQSLSGTLTASASTCTFTAQPSASWLTITPTSGTGTTNFTINVDANTGVQRTATIAIGGQTITVTQASTAACTFSLSQSSFAPTAAAQSFSGTLTASASSCAFTAQPSASWLTIAPGSGTGTTTFTITVQANNALLRTATIAIGGQTVTVNQAAPGCPYVLSPQTLSPPPAGGAYSVTVTSNPGCTWSISGVPAWVTVQSPVSLNSSGTGTINLTVGANPGVARIATLTIAGQSFAITQAGTGPNGGLRFTAIEPCRILETRAEYNFEGRSGVFGPPLFNAAETRTIPLSTSSVCRNIPANARAFVLNVTLVPNGAVDFVTVYPAGEPRPDFWTVRSPDGLIVANSAIVAAGTGGAINVYSSNRSDMIIDISGYFTDNPSTSNLVYYPLTPCRVIETRAEYRTPPGPFGPPTMAARETRTFRFPGNGYCQVPTGAAAYAATITVIPPASLPFLTAWPAGQSMPNVSSMNSPAGRVLANSVIVPASPDGSINLFTFERSDVIVDITGYFGPDDGVSGMFFFPVRQCRVSQTNGTGFTGVYSGPIFENESVRTIPIPTSSCFGIPATARAYSLNATVMPGGSPVPFLTIFPSGQPRPNASVINAFEGQIVSSGFLVSAGTNGAVDIFAFRRTHVALEISGYFGR